MEYTHKQTGVIVGLTKLTCGTEFYRPRTGIINNECIPTWVVENSNDWTKIEKELTYELSTDKAQVTRKRDGMIFKLRDIVMSYNFPESQRGTPILSFEEMTVHESRVIIAHTPAAHMNVEVLEKAIRITDDGIPVFNPYTNLYCVSPTNWSSYEGVVSSNSTGWKIFSTKEARLDYMINNMPVLTFKEITDNVAFGVYKEGVFKAKIREKLKANDSNL